jgi:uncharacterized protein YidB (DUF937 family)
MGLLDQVLGSVLGGNTQGSVTQNQASGMAEAVIAMLNDPRTGGIDGLMRRFQEGGLGDVFSSWVATGQNQAISPDELSRVLGHGQVSQISQQANLPPQQAPSLIAALLPVLIDRLTPRGQVPDQGQMSSQTGDLLKSLLGGGR